MKIPILTFHSLGDGPSPLWFPPRLFRQGLERLRRAGVRAVTVQQAALLLRQPGGATPPGRLVAITFDDGCQSVYEQARPVLRDLGWPATVFVIAAPARASDTPAMRYRPRLTWDQVGRLHETGFEIGSHTVTHPDLTRLDEAGIIAEYEGSRAEIEARVGMAPASLAYPFGAYNDLAIRLARARFGCACTADLAVADSASDSHALGRLEMHYFRNERTFALLFGPRLEPYLAARGLLRRLRLRALGRRVRE